METPIERQQAFLSDLKSLLKEYNAEICIEDFGHDYSINNKIVVDFGHDEIMFQEHGTGIVPQLVLGVSVYPE